jgi:LysM repeat protein
MIESSMNARFSKQRVTQPAQAVSRSAPVLLQRKCACGQHTTGGGECESCSGKKQMLQRSAHSAYEGEAPGVVDEVLRSPGQPLDAGTRGFMEARFAHDFSHVQTHGLAPQRAARGLEVGAADDTFEREADRVAERVMQSEPGESAPHTRMDFSRVRVHTDQRAAASAQELNALAYTVGNDVVFGAGQYAPQTTSGRALLAHELTHVLQQQEWTQGSEASPPVQRKARERTPVFSGIYDFFSNIVQAISSGFSPDTLEEYLDTIIQTGQIEDSFDSDNKAYEVYKLWKAGKDKQEIKVGKRVYRLDDKLKKLLSKELTQGSVADEEKRAAQELDAFTPQAAAPTASAPATAGPQPAQAQPLTEGEKGAAKIREGLKGQVETKDSKGKKFQVGGISANTAAQQDIKNNNVLINAEDTRHIEFIGGKLGIDISYDTPRDPYRWNMLKEIIATGKVDLLAVSKTADLDVREGHGGRVGPKVQRTLQLMSGRGALGATTIREELYKLVGSAKTSGGTSFISVTDRDQVFYVTGFASLGHELFGHVWLAMHGVPSGHGDTLQGTQTIKDPFGEPYTGTVNDFIPTFIQVTPDTDNRDRPRNPPSSSLEITDQSFKAALSAFVRAASATNSFTRESLKSPSSPEFKDTWRELKKFYIILLANENNEGTRLTQITDELKKVRAGYKRDFREEAFDIFFFFNASELGHKNPERHVVDSLKIPDPRQRPQPTGKVQPASTAPYIQQFAPPVVHEVLRSSGQPLDAETRSFMELRLNQDLSRAPVATAQSKLTVGSPGDYHEQEAERLAAQVTREPEKGLRAVDFSHVRVHTDARSAQAAQSINAQAFTIGHDIFFGPNQYSPRTTSGQHLLAHELAHVRQQSPVIHRSIAVADPDKTAPNIPPPYAEKTNAQLVQDWVGKLCPQGGWTVDGLGMVTSPSRRTFCNLNAPAALGPKFQTSETPVSCRCLCEAAAPEGKKVRVHVANYFNLGDEVKDVNKAGEGKATWDMSKSPEYHVGVSGLNYKGALGAGDVVGPFPSDPARKVVRDPPWLIFAHELCGHVSASPEVQNRKHAQTPEGSVSTIDIENKIRQEHSTPADNYGSRKGDFDALDFDAAEPKLRNYHGSVYRVTTERLLSDVLKRCDMYNLGDVKRLVFRENGDFIKSTDENINPGEVLLIRSVYWHDVGSGETFESIAETWSVTVGKLKKANPQVDEAVGPKPGQRLLIPFRGGFDP